MLTSVMVISGCMAAICLLAVAYYAAKPLTEPAITKEGNPYPKAFPPNLPGSEAPQAHPRVRIITYLLTGGYASIGLMLLCALLSMLW